MPSLYQQSSRVRTMFGQNLSHLRRGIPPCYLSEIVTCLYQRRTARPAKPQGVCAKLIFFHCRSTAPPRFEILLFSHLNKMQWTVGPLLTSNPLAFLFSLFEPKMKETSLAYVTKQTTSRTVGAHVFNIRNPITQNTHKKKKTGRSNNAPLARYAIGRGCANTKGRAKFPGRSD